MTSSVVQVTKIKKISANDEAMLLKLGRDVLPHKIYQMVYILMFLWHILGASLLPLQNEISLPFATQQGKLPDLI